MFKSHSVGKSMVSYVMGHAICEGYIESVDSKVNDWPILENTLYHDQKLINLLNFRAGDQKYVWDYYFINPRFFKNNDYSKKIVSETTSPSMDISVASNFERLIYDFFLDRDSSKCAAMFNNFPINPIELDIKIWQKKENLFSSSKVNDLDTKKIIQEIYQSFGYILDPHTAIGYGAFDKVKLEGNNIVLATAHPCKFPDAIEKAINIKSELPNELSYVLDEKENYDIVENNLDKIKNHIKERI